MKALLAAAALLLMQAGVAAELSDQERAALEQQVAAAERAFARTMADRDHAAFVSFLSEEAVFFNGNEPLRGRAKVAESWRRFYEGARAPFSWEPKVVQVLDSGTLALTSGPVLDPAGRQAGHFNSIWRLEAPGTWRVVFDKGCEACQRCAPAN